MRGPRPSKVLDRPGPGSSILVGVLVLAASAPAVAYVPTRTQKSGKAVRWHGTNCVVVRPNVAGTSGVNDGSEFTALLRAMQNWHAATAGCSYLRFRAAQPMSHAEATFVRGEVNENVVHYVEGGWTHDAAATALTTVKYLSRPGHPGDGKILDADIEMNGEFYAFGTSAEVATDIENTLTHELGHVVGLDHPCDDGSFGGSPPVDDEDKPIPDCALASIEMQETTMYNFADPGETKKRTPEADDIRGFCSSYPLADDPGRCAVLSVELEGGCTFGQAVDRCRWPWLLLVALLSVCWRARRGARVGCGRAAGPSSTRRAAAARRSPP